MKNVTNYGAHKWAWKPNPNIWACVRCGMERFSKNALPAGGCAPVAKPKALPA